MYVCFASHLLNAIYTFLNHFLLFGLFSHIHKDIYSSEYFDCTLYSTYNSCFILLHPSIRGDMYV